MKFVLDSAQTAYTIKSYTGDAVIVGDVCHALPFVIMPTGVRTDLLPARFGELTLTHLESIAAMGAEILLVGSGRRQIFLDTGVISALGARGIGVEVMGTASACRCYNVLASEQRAVAAALFID